MKLKNIAMITEDKITEIFCIIDEFCKFFEQENGKKQNNSLYSNLNPNWGHTYRKADG